MKKQLQKSWESLYMWSPKVKTNLGSKNRRISFSPLLFSSSYTFIKESIQWAFYNSWDNADNEWPMVNTQNHTLRRKFEKAWTFWDFQRICLQCGRPRFDPWIGKIHWGRAWQSTPVVLPGESPWTEDPGGLQSLGSKESDTTEQQSTCTFWAEEWMIQDK